MSDWLIFNGGGEPHSGMTRLPAPPNWRNFKENRANEAERRLGSQRRKPSDATIRMVNAALYLRRPLLVTGKPGVGKSSLAYEVATELRLGTVLKWPISSRSTLGEGLYTYDPIGRLREESIRHRAAHKSGEATEESTADDKLIGEFLTLGPLGTALLPSEQPRVLLIDEIDKSDIDLPNDLLNVFEDGEYKIPELRRVAKRTPEIDVLSADGEPARIKNGIVQCEAFPFIVMTSNDEREFPHAFLRRCLRLNLGEPEPDEIAAMVESHLGEAKAAAARAMIDKFAADQKTGVYATDQILSAVYLRYAQGDQDADDELMRTVNAVLSDLSNPATP
jgi:MoxR-like ATPase